MPNKIRLPRDPDQQNKDRSDAAERAILSFAGDYGEWHGEPVLDDEMLKQNLEDLLTDIAHLCDRRNLHYAYLLAVARHLYDEETEKDGMQFERIIIGRKRNRNQ